MIHYFVLHLSLSNDSWLFVFVCYHHKDFPVLFHRRRPGQLPLLQPCSNPSSTQSRTQTWPLIDIRNILNRDNNNAKHFIWDQKSHLPPIDILPVGQLHLDDLVDLLYLGLGKMNGHLILSWEWQFKIMERDSRPPFPYWTITQNYRNTFHHITKIKNHRETVVQLSTFSSERNCFMTRALSPALSRSA